MSISQPPPHSSILVLPSPRSTAPQLLRVDEGGGEAERGGHSHTTENW